MAVDYMEDAMPAQSPSFSNGTDNLVDLMGGMNLGQQESALSAQQSSAPDGNGAMLAQIMEGMKALISGQQAQAVQIATLQNEKKIVPLTTPTTTATPPTPPPAKIPTAVTTVHRPRARLPDPAKFSGDRTGWPAWKVTMENKLALDEESIGGPDAMFLYIYSRLEGNALKNVTTFVKQHRQTGGAPPQFFAYLETLYGDPNAQARAATRLHRLKQGEKQTFAKFLPILERELADAGALHWPDNAKRPILLAALNRSMRTSLVHRGIPENFNDIILRLHEISNDLDMANLGDRTHERTHERNRTPPESKGSGGDEMDWEPTVAKVGSTRERAKWVSKEEIEARKEGRRCLRCGKKGHFIDKCPLLPQARKSPRGP